MKVPKLQNGKHTPSQAASWLADVDKGTISFMHRKYRRKADIKAWPISRHTCWLPNGKPLTTAFFARIVNHNQVSMILQESVLIIRRGAHRSQMDPEKTQVYQLDSMPAFKSPSANCGLETVPEVHGYSEITLSNDLPAVDRSVILYSESEVSDGLGVSHELMVAVKYSALPPKDWGDPGSASYPFLHGGSWDQQTPTAETPNSFHNTNLLRLPEVCVAAATS